MTSPEGTYAGQTGGSTINLGDLSDISSTDLSGVLIVDHTYNGTGCPDGSVAAALTPDKQALSILFDDNFVLLTDEDTFIASATCNIAITLQVPDHQSVALVRYDYRGGYYVPFGSVASFHSEYFFAGEEGPITDKIFTTFDEFLFFSINDEVQTGEQLQSECGRDVILRANTRINAVGPDVYINFDSAEIDTGFEYELQWNPC
ncbi:MAG: DUF4360 domain-containing protein [Myxococcales bacterium]|nr:DUF4360 domain-containing protein [Myxococcales bacterium]